MLRLRKNKNNGQTTGEYAIMIFVIIIAISSMTIFIKRALLGRIRDARNYMISTVNATYTATRSGSTPEVVSFEYEPYYAQTNSLISRENNDQFNLSRGGGGRTGQFTATFNETTTVNTTSVQLPPKEVY